jgi:pantoate--beta-alanine ligase
VKIVTSKTELRLARADLGEIGLVPTMGYLHEGHLSLVRAARRDNACVAVSIFVNPTQFGPSEDFEHYPRDLNRDLDLLKTTGVDLVFTPQATDIYPEGFGSRIDLGPVTQVLEGAIRPTHFSGVATIVTKLFNLFQPRRAYFGQKDAQQCVVIRRLVRDFDMPVDICIMPTSREADGLALSSRNVYLSAAERAAAPVLYQSLMQAKSLYDKGERRADVLRAAIADTLASQSLGRADYVSIADRDSLVEAQGEIDTALASLAVRFGKCRLIDNVILS